MLVVTLDYFVDAVEPLRKAPVFVALPCHLGTGDPPLPVLPRYRSIDD